MLHNRPFRTVLLSASVLLVLATAGCGGGQPGEYEERAAVIDRLRMEADTATATTGMNNQVRLQAPLRTSCDTIEIEGRGNCELRDAIRWIVRDTAVVRLYVHTSSGFEARDTAAATFLARRQGRTWVIVRSQQRELSDSTLLLVESGS